MQEPSEKPVGGYAWYALALLMVVYIFNFLDRQIIYILFPKIKAEMAFSDFQLTLLGTTSFAIFYTLLGIPFGRMADKRARTTLIAIGVAVWCLFSGLTGFAWDFWTLFFCRVMVGIGEAALGPAAISILSDYFPPAKRATVTSIYSMGIAIGAGLAAILGGGLSEYGWRAAFMLVGFSGIIFAVLVFTLREPARTVNTSAIEERFTSEDWKKLLSTKSFVLLCLGYALFGLATNNISVWGAVYLSRIYDFKIPFIGYWLGLLTLFAGVPATLFGGMLADKFRRSARGGRMIYGAILSSVSALLWLLILFSDNFYLIVPAGFILIAAALGWVGAAAADATEIAGIHLRGLGVAICFFGINFAAFIIGSNLIAKLNDLSGIVTDPQTGITTNAEMMRYTMLVCPISCLLGALCLWFGSRSLNQTLK